MCIARSKDDSEMSSIDAIVTTCIRSEQASTARDAAGSESRSPLERLAVFADLCASLDAITSSFPAEERARRARIAFEIDPLPEPWWANFRDEALAEFQCPT
jgi:hypothetical protein